ncbi:DgyrCDS4780 [Dimorphilus gyrociliatus]|uniref:DgyrCDS4780 n=1 Tax=Dimorphilus gyrociliatus TaxID=2664684 RepID=A0A7I8VI13_9ANNE|nr:DgyrCDS4780 [Dimorphilus gyrociliatus]
MSVDILDSLEDLGYNGPLLEEQILLESVKNGAKSQQFTGLIEFLTKEISQLAGIDEYVRGIDSETDCDNFLLELSGFLREFGCPYSSLIEGDLSERLNNEKDCLALLDYLCTELQALKMTAVDNPNLLTAALNKQSSNENELAGILKKMLINLQFNKPPPNVTISQIFMKIESKIKELTEKYGSKNFTKGVLKSRLSSKQLETAALINSALKQDYSTRREMLIKRFDVTVQSFRWSERAKAKENEIQQVYQPVRAKLRAQSSIDIEHILAAREDLLTVGKTSSGIDREKTKTSLNRVLIGNVPDRGGRAHEHDIPPPEMPAFQKRQAAPQPQRQYSGRGGGERGRGRGQGNNYNQYGASYSQQGYQGTGTDGFFGGQQQSFQGQFQPQYGSQQSMEFDGRKNYGGEAGGRGGRGRGRGGRGRGGRW